MYTAAAIAHGICQPEAVVDGNVYRVLARIFGMDDDISAPAGKKALKKGKGAFDTGQPGIYNQAIMESGRSNAPEIPGCKATHIFFRAMPGQKPSTRAAREGEKQSA